MKKRYLFSILIALLLLFGAIGFFLLNRGVTRTGSSIDVSISGNAQAISQELHDAGVIRSKLFFLTLARLTGNTRSLKEGLYRFSERESSTKILNRITTGDYQIDRLTVTIPEGFNVYEIGEALEKAGMNFTKEEFISYAREREGFLFPETYNFLESDTPEQVVRVMEKELVKNIESLLPKVDSDFTSLRDVIIMASIVEEEATTKSDREKVAGILWKRLANGMPLQVDATFVYVNAKSTWNLTTEDLQIDSPYNTYRYKGLPPGPITNPGLESIAATVNYQKTPYLFYLSDRQGRMYYAKTYAEHKVNISKYLK